MYAILARIPDGLDPLRKRFEEHVRKAGLAAIEKLSSAKADGATTPKEGDEAEAKSGEMVGSHLVLSLCLFSVG